jgi:hypothetical protein
MKFEKAALTIEEQVELLMSRGMTGDTACAALGRGIRLDVGPRVSPWAITVSPVGAEKRVAAGRKETNILTPAAFIASARNDIRIPTPTAFTVTAQGEARHERNPEEHAPPTIPAPTGRTDAPVTFRAPRWGRDSFGCRHQGFTLGYHRRPRWGGRIHQ